MQNKDKKLAKKLAKHAKKCQKLQTLKKWQKKHQTKQEDKKRTENGQKCIKLKEQAIFTNTGKTVKK